MIKVQDLYDKINGGIDVLRYYYQDIDPERPTKPIKIRDDDAHPSAGIFLKEGIWYIKDQGGSDNKAYNAVELVRKNENLSYKDAINWIAGKFAPELAKDSSLTTFSNKPVMSKVAPSSELRLIKRESGKFTDAELSVLGYKITQATCDEFSLIPLDGYITKEKGGVSWKIESSDTYPIMIYNYQNWGKIYQPFGDLRFMYYGTKPEGYVFGPNEFTKVWSKALKGEYPHVPEFRNKKMADDDYLNDDDERWDSLVICSGPSDALNVYQAGGFMVCWPNSESEPISSSTISKLTKLTKSLYVLYDADTTGIKNAYKIALQNLDTQIIKLPSDLNIYKTIKGKPCKDIKDYMMYYRRGSINPHFEFKYKLVKLAKALKFWIESEDAKGKKSYEISNANLYEFLNANGFHKMATKDEDIWRFVFVQGRIVEVIPDNAIVAIVKDYLVNFIKEHTEYYSITLENTIHRSKQFTAESFKMLETVDLDFEACTKDAEFFFFRNVIVKVTADSLTEMKVDDCPFYIYSNKIIQHDFHIIKEPLYCVNYSEQYNYALQVQAQYSPLDPQYAIVNQEIDKLTNDGMFSIKFGKEQFDFMQFIYNTGNKFWREEKEAHRNGTELSQKERNIINLNFINKVTTIGYLLSKFKSEGKAKAVYCMETKISEEEEGTHKGGTGKSIYIKSLKHLRNQILIPGQRTDPKKMDFIYQRVTTSTDIVNIDDLNRKMDLNAFLTDITGELVINRKNKDEFSIDYKDAPRFCISSNHAIFNFDDSLRRRIHIVGFSDYYHSAKPSGEKEFSPLTEFGRNLISDYDDNDMNIFYNFMLENVQTFMRFGLVESDKEEIEQRQLQNKIGIDFLFWADEYLEDKIEQVVDIKQAYHSFKESAAGFMKINTFKKKLIDWCDIRGYVFNPEWYMQNLSETERQRNAVRFYDSMNNPCYGFYIEPKKT